MLRPEHFALEVERAFEQRNGLRAAALRFERRREPRQRHDQRRICTRQNFLLGLQRATEMSLCQDRLTQLLARFAEDQICARGLSMLRTKFAATGGEKAVTGCDDFLPFAGFRELRRLRANGFDLTLRLGIDRCCPCSEHSAKDHQAPSHG